MPSKPRRRPVSTDKRLRRASQGSDYGPPERWQHSGRTLEHTERAGILAARATEEHIVDILVLRSVLDETQRAAAFRFKQDYQHAGLEDHITGSYNPMRGGDAFHRAHERSVAEEAAYQRWRNALRHLGMRFSGAVITVVCNDKLPLPREMTLLQAALERLAKYYGMV